jgi:hypothetical protein
LEHDQRTLLLSDQHGDRGVLTLDAPAVSACVSEDGRVIGALDEDGTVWAISISRSEPVMLVTREELT